MKTLEELFEAAAQYGNLYLHQSEQDRTFSCTIAFMTSQKVKLEAKSGFRHPSVASALAAAIAEAQGIIDAIGRMPAWPERGAAQPQLANGGAV